MKNSHNGIEIKVLEGRLEKQVSDGKFHTEATVGVRMLWA